MKKWEVCKRAAAVALSMSLAVGGVTPVITANADENSGNTENAAIANKYSSQGYHLAWDDEFNGDKLNTNDWNVEAHEPGWVNSELQAYTDEAHSADNIAVTGGALVIQPTAKKKEDVKPSETDQTKTDTETGKEILKSTSFDDKNDNNWKFSTGGTGKADVEYQNGKAVIDVKNSGTENWHVQLQQNGLSLKKGHKYSFSMKASSTVDRAISISALDPDNGYAWYGGTGDNNPIVKSTEAPITFAFEVTDKESSDTIALQINLGLIGNADDSKPAVVTLSDVSLKDLTPETNDTDVKAYDFTSGRINTQGKHDFTYGRFEARAKVPTGQGYLPAFWLMASDESLYGQWPKCGEMDIMEVMGQETNKSYHTIHYGYSQSASKQNQGTDVLTDGDFASDWHTFALDWEPGKLTWYVDDKEVYTTNDWYTGSDEESQLTYPAPFDQNFYVILNLAVGGSWVGNPDQSTIDDMANQSYQVDYVRVYQKSPEEYAKEEAQAKRPVKEVTFRKADENGNYVLNSDFSKDVAASDAKEVSDWQLHLEADGAGTTSVVSGNAITITPAAAGSQNHSVQLKQEGIPMYKGWEYELSFDASSTEDRTIIADIEGPDNNWTRYFKDTTVNIGKEKKTYTYDFTMNDKTDANGCLEFNLGNQGSKAPVTISNVKLTHKSGEEIKETTEKTVRADGNYVYNGTFDQGEGRLGYWNVSDKDAVTVTNDKNVRKLQVTVKDTPVTVSQSELAPYGTGNFELSFDAYTKDGATDGVSIAAGGNEYTPELTDTDKTFTDKFETKEITRDKSGITITFSKPGTYYLDNVAIREDAMIKNGSFDNGTASYATGAYEPGVAAFSVDSIKSERPNALDVDIKNTGDADWNVQLKQSGINLVKGHTYKLTFDGRSTLNRTISVVMQRDGTVDNNWDVYSGDNNVDLTNDWKSFEKTFTMNSDSDVNALLSVSLGAVAGKQITDEHHVYLDNFKLEEVSATTPEEPENPAEPSTPSTPATPGSGTTVTPVAPSTDNDQKPEDTTDKPDDKDTKPSDQNKNTEKKTVTVSKNTTRIKANEYSGNKTVTKVTLKGTKVTSVGKNAFANCTNLKTIDLSKQKKLTTISANAFKNCKNLKTIKINANSLKKVDKKAFAGSKNTKSVKVTVYAKTKKQYNKAVKMLKKAGLSKATFKFVKK